MANHFLKVGYLIPSDWGVPIYFRARYYKRRFKPKSKWFSMVIYGHSSWASRCEWIVPGTITE